MIYLTDRYSLIILRFNPEPRTIEDITNLPQALSLSQNYPNPFNAQTTIQYDLPAASDVALSIYDIQGRKVGTLVNEHQSAGHHQMVWDASGFPSGIYFYKVQAGEFSQTQKAVLIK